MFICAHCGGQVEASGGAPASHYWKSDGVSGMGYRPGFDVYCGAECSLAEHQNAAVDGGNVGRLIVLGRMQ